MWLGGHRHSIQIRTCMQADLGGCIPLEDSQRINERGPTGRQSRVVCTGARLWGPRIEPWWQRCRASLTFVRLAASLSRCFVGFDVAFDQSQPIL